MHTMPALPQELTIYTASETRKKWLAWLAEEHPAATPEHLVATSTMDAAAVDQVDAAGVQLLLSLSHMLKNQGVQLRLSDASAPLREACAALGLSDRLLPPACGDAS